MDQGNTGTAAPFLKEKETSRPGWNNVWVWNWPWTDKGSILVLEKGLFTVLMFSAWVEKPHFFPRAREKSKLKLVVFSEAKLSDTAPSSACLKSREEKQAFPKPPWELRSLKQVKNEPSDHFEHAIHDSQTDQGKFWSTNWKMGLWREKWKKIWGYLQLFEKVKGKSYGSEAEEVVWNLSQEKYLYPWTFETLSFWRKTFLSFNFSKTVLWSSLEFATSSLYKLVVRFIPKQTTEW